MSKVLREITSADLDEFFIQLQDPEANLMAAFAPRNPKDRGVFDYHWNHLLSDPNTQALTIDDDGQAVGALICSHLDDVPQLSFWMSRSHWGQGLTTAAVDEFLDSFEPRPIQAYVPADNAGTQKVLLRCGFEKIGEEKSFSNARAEVISEHILQLG